MKAKQFKYGNFIAYLILAAFIFSGIFAPFLANDAPLLCKNESGWTAPAFSSQKYEDCSFSVSPLIKYSHNNIDAQNSNFISPFDEQNLSKGQQKHFLGTDQIGRDVASGLIHGSRIALITGSFSMTIALVIGLLFGLVGGYFGNTGYQIRRKKLINLIFLFFSFIYFLSYRSLLLSTTKSLFLFIFLVLIIALFIHFLFGKIPYLNKKMVLPVDLILSSFIEIFQSLPGSFLILILVSLFAEASIFNVILVIGLLRWPMIARYVRAEMFKIKEQRYIEASKAIGMSDWRIIIRHALPATLTPVIVAVAFGFSSAILLESALSFLGIGLPADHVSFGSILSAARLNYEAWWLAVFPGMAIFSLVFVFNYLGDKLSKKISKK
jgi:peptide/nickel transport system permease protein